MTEVTDSLSLHCSLNNMSSMTMNTSPYSWGALAIGSNPSAAFSRAPVLLVTALCGTNPAAVLVVSCMWWSQTNSMFRLDWFIHRGFFLNNVCILN